MAGIKRPRPHLGSARLAAVAAGLVLVLAMLAYRAWTDTSLDRALEQGSLRIGYAVEAPYAYLKDNGEVTGISPEVARQVAARLGIRRILWRQSDFGRLCSELEARRVDVVAAGMFITHERARRVLFSDPEFHVREGLLVPRGNPRALHAYRDAVLAPGARLAVISGAVEEDLVRHLGMPDSRVVRVPDALTGRVAVESGQADGLCLSSVTIHRMASEAQMGTAEEASPFRPTGEGEARHLGYGAFAFNLQDRRLCSAWNRAMRGFIGSAEHRRLVAPFGVGEPEMPGAITAGEVVGP